MFQVTPERAGDESLRAIAARKVNVIDSMLKDVVKYGTATRALSLKRTDIAGKTGTTNDSIDAWFAGYNPKIVGVAWIGFDKPRNLGNKETGGGLALPVWIGYMQKALQNVPVIERELPVGVAMHNGDLVYMEYAEGGGVNAINGATEEKPADGKPPEKREEGPKGELF